MKFDYKEVSGIDDNTKKLVGELLEGNRDYSFSVDCVYKTVDKGYLLIEFIKCSDVKTLYDNPNSYWDTNEEVYIKLWNLKEKLNATLLFINYSDNIENDIVIYNIENLNYIKYKSFDVKKTIFTFQQAQSWFRDVNKRACNGKVESSKQLEVIDNEAKDIIIKLLNNDKTCGFDLDLMYFISHKGYYIIEFLKCDTVTPEKSHPNRYWFKNKKKFFSLWEISKNLGGQLLLLNYSIDRNEKIKIMKVLNVNELGIEEESIVFDFEESKKWIQQFNYELF